MPSAIGFSLRFRLFAGKDGSKVTMVVATPGQGPDRPQEVSYTDTKVIIYFSLAATTLTQIGLFVLSRKGDWQWQLWRCLPGQIVRLWRNGRHQESTPGQEI